MSKKIVFCADGTWNGPDQDDDGDRQADPTNVYKLFVGLAGTMSIGSIREADEQEKELSKKGEVLQVAKYIHGVGDSTNPIRKIMGGAFGAGSISRIVRGYTFISRNYEPGDDIVVAGFSRGAYTARALAGLIASQGLLRKELTADREQAYRLGAKAWYQYREKPNQAKAGLLAKLAEAVADLPAFISREGLKGKDLVAVKRIKSVAVWDTVGALGLPLYLQDKRADMFRFADTALSPKVEKGFHAISLDEQRLDFTPTLWDKADNVIQAVFPGAHADVGGGYTMNRNESGLSDIALGWMIDQLKTVEVQFVSPLFPGFSPDAKGTAHQPWLHPPFNLPGAAAPRKFPKNSGISVHPSVAQRSKAGPVVQEPGVAPVPYQPKNLPA